MWPSCAASRRPIPRRRSTCSPFARPATASRSSARAAAPRSVSHSSRECVHDRNVVVFSPMAKRAPARVLALLVATSVGANGQEVPDTVVEVRGTPALAIRVADMKEVEPSETSRRAVNRGPVWHALVTLAVVPHRIVWQHAEGLSLGVTPVLFYGIPNRQAGALVMQLPPGEKLCARVKTDKGPVPLTGNTRNGGARGGG